MCMRAMLNCGLERLRLVAPRDGWPNERAVATAADADRVIEGVEVFDSVAEAVADCGRVYASTARKRGQELPVVEAGEVVGEICEEAAECAILFGPEASGLDKEALSHADRLLCFPVNPEFASLNLAQAVLLFGWEWWRGSGGAKAPERLRQAAAPKEQLGAFLARLEGVLEEGRFFSSPMAKPGTVLSVRAMFQRMAPSERELKMLHGVVTALCSEEAREGKAGIGTGEETASAGGNGEPAG